MGTLFGFVLLVLSFAFLLRFLLEFHRVDFYNPHVQGLVRFTDPPLRLLGKVIPNIGYWNVPLLLVLLGLQSLVLLVQGFPGGATATMALAAVQVVARALDVYIVCLLITVIGSWIQFTGRAQPFLAVVESISRPLLSRMRRLLPDTGILDFSPMLAVLGIIVVQSMLTRVAGIAAHL